MTATGTIRRFKPDESTDNNRGHGFILPDGGGPDVFFLVTKIQNEYTPRIGDRVEYVVDLNPKEKDNGPVAIRVLITEAMRD